MYYVTNRGKTRNFSFSIGFWYVHSLEVDGNSKVKGFFGLSREHKAKDWRSWLERGSTKGKGKFPFKLIKARKTKLGKELKYEYTEYLTFQPVFLLFISVVCG